MDHRSLGEIFQSDTKLEERKTEGKGQIFRPCAFVGIGNSEQEMQQLSLDDKVRGDFINHL